MYKKATLANQEKALKKPCTAYYFAKHTKGADIEKCQEIACINPKYAYLFAAFVPGADIERCQEVVCKDPEWAYNFARRVPGADIKKCIKACKGTKYEDILNQYLMNKALL